MTKPERQRLNALLGANENGRRLLKEIQYLERDSNYFRGWSDFVRKICRATAMLGDFGMKGPVLLRVNKRDCQSVSAAIGGLMRHGVVYATGAHLYPIWDVRRPQHGWFQPITVFAEDMKVFRRDITKALRSPLYGVAPVNALKLLFTDTLPRPSTALSLLESYNPLLFTEAYRYIARHSSDFVDFRISKEELRAYAREKESNCNNPRDRKLGLWSLATGKPLPLSPEDIRTLTKYNCFVQLFTTVGKFDISRTNFFRVKRHLINSARDFTRPFSECVIRLLREYYLYTLATGFPRELLYEKKKEILFMYCVQGRVLLEGPHSQARRAERFLRRLDILGVLSDGRKLRETLLKHSFRIPKPRTEFLLLWLMRYGKSHERFIDLEREGTSQADRMILPPYPHLYDRTSESDI